MTSMFMETYLGLCRQMLSAPTIHTGSWQSIDTSASALHETFELTDVTISSHYPALALSTLQNEMAPVLNLPWAEMHFQERVGGVPVNPPPSHTQWPWARHNKRFQEGEQGPFSHSYPERIWPRYTSSRVMPGDGDFVMTGGKLYNADRYGTPIGGPIDMSQFPLKERQGIRFRYGDLNDVIDLLVREPLTRQAYLPIWFPEDTGRHHGERVPCTLGYHFMMRDGRLSCRYYMRSCDLVRHFADDVYMACRLTQWICDEVNDRWGDGRTMLPGHLLMYITSLHAFIGDKYHIKKLLAEK